jgi:small-conductance mechanosensitive channel
MSQITIQCRLVASEDTRHQLWQLMAQQNTPMINELLKQVAEHPEFETWRQKGKLPGGIVSKLCKPLKEDSRFSNQPGRFYTSATKLVEYIYQSWLALQQRLQWRLKGQQHWLEILKSDQDLCQQADCSLETLRCKASEMLASLQPSTSQSKKKKKSKKQKNSSGKSLFDAYDNAEDSLTRSAIAYLLKNNCKIPEQEEDPEKFAQRRRKTEIKVERLTRQIESSLPKGRDLTGERWLETLLTAANTVPKDKEEFKSWQNILLTKPKSVPFPISYETNEDLTWSKNEKGRICVKFSGLGGQTQGKRILVKLTYY